MSLAFGAIGLALTIALTQGDGASAKKDRQPSIQTVHIQRGGVLVLGGKVMGVAALRRVAESWNIYVLADEGLPLSDVQKATDQLTQLPPHHVFLIMQAKAAP